jgi:hypothetical protein
MITHVLTIWAAGPGQFNARIGKRVLCLQTATPFRDSACALLDQALAQPSEKLVMRFAGSPHTILEGSIAKAVGLGVFRAASWS